MTNAMRTLMEMLKTALDKNDYPHAVNIGRRLLESMELACSEIDKWPVLECAGCHRKFVSTRVCGSPQLYCSRKCLDADKVRKTRDARMARLLGRTCAHCGQPIPVERISSAQYCSDVCLRASENAKKHTSRMARRIGRSCAHCGQPIPVEKMNHSKYCSRMCKTNAACQRRREAERNA